MPKCRKIDTAKLRVAMGSMTNAELAEAAGVDLKTVNRAVKEGVPITRVLDKLAKVLGKPRGWFYPGTSTPTAAGPTQGSHPLTGVAHLVGPEEIYRSATALCGDMEERIRIVLSANAPRAPVKGFVPAIASRMSHLLRTFPDREIQLEAVFIVDPSADRVKFQAEMAKRDGIMEEHGITEAHRRFRIIQSHSFPRFDVIVVDSQHAQIGFARHGQKGEIFHAIEFCGQRGLVAGLADWCDAALKQGMSYQEWLVSPPSAQLSIPTETPRLA